MKQCLDFSDNPDTPGLCSVCGHTRSAHAGAAKSLPVAPAQDAVACTCSQAGFPSSCYNCDAEASDIVNALRKLYSTHPICAQAANYIERKLRDMATPSEPLQCLRCGTVDAFGPAARSPAEGAAPTIDDVPSCGQENDYRRARPTPAEGEPLTTLQQLKASIGTRINDLLCETKTGHDDSVVGINEAWDVVRKACDEYISRASK